MLILNQLKQVWLYMIRDPSSYPFPSPPPPPPPNQVPEGSTGFQLQAFESASICIIIKGEGEASNSSLKQPLKLRKGTVFFVAADVDVSIKINGTDGMLLFRAYAGVF